jgi:hypothetical protein
MEISIERSTRMDKDDKCLEVSGSIHYPNIIRIPFEYREQVKLSIGEFINLKNKDSSLEPYEVLEAFEDDVKNNSKCAYIASSNYDKLSIVKNGGEIKRVNNITLGCDPEAFLINRSNGKLISTYLLLKKFGDVGNDGQLIEFRPNPNIHPEIVCNNLFALINKARRMLDRIVGGKEALLVGGSSCQGATAGFHLHYGFPRSILGNTFEVFNLSRVITYVFDYYVGVPSIIPEGNSDVFRRSVTGLRYGKPGEFRVDNRTFEFRLPGGINLLHPVLTNGLLSLGALVAEDIVSRINTCTDNFLYIDSVSSVKSIKELYPNLPEAKVLHGIICNSDISLARRHYNRIKDDVRLMVGYEKRCVAIEKYFDCLDKNIKFSNLIERNWGEYYNEKQ